MLLCLIFFKKKQDVDHVEIANKYLENEFEEKITLIDSFLIDKDGCDYLRKSFFPYCRYIMKQKKNFQDIKKNYRINILVIFI